MQQRKKQPEQTRRAILEAAGEEFSHHGYAGTGLGAIVTRAALTKGAMFHYFPDKQSLAEAWINEHLAAGMDALWVQALTEPSSLDGLQAVCRVRCLALRPGDTLSALVSLTAETAVTSPRLGAALERVFEAWRGAVAALLERGQAAGWIHRSIRPPVEAALLVSAFAGFSVTTRSAADDGVLRACSTALDAYLETLRAP